MIKIKTTKKVEENRVCPYCRSDIDLSQIVVACGSCHTFHHHDCWYETKKCSVCSATEMLVRDQDHSAVSALMTDGHRAEIALEISAKIDEIYDLKRLGHGEAQYNALNKAYELQLFINTLEPQEKAKQQDSLELVLELIRDLEPEVHGHRIPASELETDISNSMIPTLMILAPALCVIAFLLLQPDFWTLAPTMGSRGRPNTKPVVGAIVFTFIGCSMVALDQLAARNQENTKQLNNMDLGFRRTTIQGVLCVYMAAGLSLVNYLR